MDLFSETVIWSKELKPLLEKYKHQNHPLNYQNLYQLVIMVILSAQDSDENINRITPSFFLRFPNIESLAQSRVEEITSYLHQVKYYDNKANWIINLAKTIKKDSDIPLSMKELTNFKGIGRKSANVIMREAKIPLEGIMVDLHVLRVAPRIGLIKTTKDGIIAEKQLMAILPKEIWNEIGLSISFLGREICRPTPKCLQCPIISCCNYSKSTI